MLIDNELILQAKERLGDMNAEIMAEVLGLDDYGYDERNKKACCPYHDEDTPSFVYDTKRHFFKCFGCGKNVDIIDAFMEKGDTFIQATQKLFDYADIEYSFGEVNVKTKTAYKYPKEVECDSKQDVCDYLGRRKISSKTIDYLDIRQDAYGNCVFNYYDTNDVLTLVKYRPSRKVQKGENKTWCQKGADTTPLLFNMNRINTTQPLLITEGELDCASAIESGFLNAVSVPLGANNYHWMEENWDWIENFDSIIICADNDEAGEKMRKECLYRLGSWRTKLVQIPKTAEVDGKEVKINDLNECLFYLGKAKTLDIILNAKDTPVESVVDFSDIQEVDLHEIDGIYTGIKEFDEEMMRLFYGTFNIVSGTNGSGKSSFLSQLICESLDQDKDVWLYSKELPNYMSKNWINYIFAGGRNIDTFETDRGSKYYKVKEEAKNKINEFYRGRLNIYKDGHENTMEAIQTSMIESARKFGSKLFIVDNLTAINYNCTENEKWGKQVDFINFCIEFAKKYHVVVICIIHPKKLETMRRMTKFDVQGLGSSVDLAHRLIALYRVTPQDKKGTPKTHGKGWLKEPIPFDVLLDVLKDRMRGRENMSIGMFYDAPSRRFYTNEQEFDRQYAWDTNTYTTPSGYIDRSITTPFE